MHQKTLDRRKKLPARAVRRFESWEGPAARQSWKRYFDIKRVAKGQRPVELAEEDGAW